MSVESYDLAGIERAKSLVTCLESGASVVLSAVKWTAIVALGIGWLVFWSNLVRLNLALGNVVAAVVTGGVFIGPLVVIVPKWILGTVDADGVVGAGGSDAGSG